MTLEVCDGRGLTEQRMFWQALKSHVACGR